MSVAGATHTPQTRPPGAVPGAPSCAPTRRAAPPTRAPPGPRSSPVALASREPQFQAQLFSTSAAGSRRGESRRSRSLPLRCPTPVPAAPRPVPFPPRGLRGRRSRVPAPAAAHPPGLRRHPRGDPAAPLPRVQLSLPGRAGSGAHSPPGSASPSAQASQRGFPLRLLAAAHSGPAGAREGGGGRRERRRREEGAREGGERVRGWGRRSGRASADLGRRRLARREEKEGRGQRKKEAAAPPRPGPAPRRCPVTIAAAVPLSAGRPGEGSARDSPGAGGRRRAGGAGPASGGECPAGPGGCGRKGIPGGGAGAWEPVTAPSVRRRLRSPAQVPRARGEPLGTVSRTGPGRERSATSASGWEAESGPRRARAVPQAGPKRGCPSADPGNPKREGGCLDPALAFLSGEETRA